LAGAERPCPHCQDVVWIPEGPENDERDEEFTRRGAAKRRGARWPWVIGVIVVLAAAGAGVCYYLGFWGLTRPTRPSVWKDAKAAKVTLLIKEENIAEVDPFPERDFPAHVKKNLSAQLQAGMDRKFELARLIQEVENKKRDGGLELAFYLFPEREPNWPKDDATLKTEIWGMRMSQGMFFYDLKLDGKQQEDGSYKGQAIGRIQLKPKVWIPFKDAEFQLQPWTIVEDDRTPGKDKKHN
jgi:hypothetical protein